MKTILLAALLVATTLCAAAPASAQLLDDGHGHRFYAGAAPPAREQILDDGHGHRFYAGQEYQPDFGFGFRRRHAYDGAAYAAGLATASESGGYPYGYLPYGSPYPSPAYGYAPPAYGYQPTQYWRGGEIEPPPPVRIAQATPTRNPARTRPKTPATAKGCRCQPAK